MRVRIRARTRGAVATQGRDIDDYHAFIADANAAIRADWKHQDDIINALPDLHDINGNTIPARWLSTVITTNATSASRAPCPASRYESLA